jgi:hypothetical protein
MQDIISMIPEDNYSSLIVRVQFYKDETHKDEPHSYVK